MDASPISRIDLTRFANNLGNDGAVIDEILVSFVEVSDALILQLQRDVKARQVLLWLQHLHHLKGAALNITAKRLAGLCDEAETIRQLPHPHAEAILFHIQKELAYLRNVIRDYQTQAQSLPHSH